VNPDFRDMLAALSGEGVEYLLVGAHALAVHGHPRATRDLDLWVAVTGENSGRLWRVLEQFGAPMQQLTIADLQRPDLVFQIGVPPQRIDILTSIDGVDFPSAFRARLDVDLEGIRVPVISRSHLIQNKRASGRAQDLADLEALGERT